jgi:RNAse (barnase) inhibitor barstar
MAARALQLSVTAHLQSLKPPWTVLLVLQAGQRAESVVKTPEGFVLRVIRGRKCRSTEGLFMEIAEAMKFPDYFGHNWDALEECLADLEWLTAKGYVLCFTEAELILSDEEDEFATFLEVLNDAGEAWASGDAGPQGDRAKPFHSLLTVSGRNIAKRMHWGLPPMMASPVGRSGRKRSPSRPK